MSDKPKPKFALHPGYIESANDRQWHYVDISQLARLYELKIGEFIVWTKNDKGRDWDSYIHLYPQYHHNQYGRPRGH